MLRNVIASDIESSAQLSPAFDRITPFRVEADGALGDAHPFHQRATPVIDPIVQISPSEAVTRHGVRWPGMAGEVVQANRRGRINFRFCAPLHMLVIFERGVRQEGGTSVQGLPQSTLRDCGRKLILVPAGHEYHDWHEPRTLPRMIFFYFTPAHLASVPELHFSSTSFAPRLFFEDGA